MVELAEHDPRWAEEYERVASVILDAMGPGASVHHIGSTSIPTVSVAKPVIDALVAVPMLAQADAAEARMALQGFEARGEYGIAGRRYFTRPAAPGQLKVHVHAFQAGDEQVTRHLAFRNYLRTHPAEAQAYAELKRALAVEQRLGPEAYQQGKSAFISRIDRLAVGWHASASTGATS
jgi:GrpB-like predicted nucleotidyltransferase (UPF0157 family)